MSKILIAIPTFENIMPETFKSIYDLDPCGNELSFEFVKGYDCARARNDIVKKALDGGFDYIFMADSDMIIPQDALVRMLEYQTRRLHTELGSLIIGPSMVQEGLKIIKSPAAGINTIENALDLIGLINPYNYEFFGGEEALVKSGRYKGKNKATKLFFESPLVPMNKTLYKGLHPEEGIPFYKQ
jgi:glycosyltransferase involved in cell wall biosynthesis